MYLNNQMFISNYNHENVNHKTLLLRVLLIAYIFTINVKISCVHVQWIFFFWESVQWFDYILSHEINFDGTQLN